MKHAVVAIFLSCLGFAQDNKIPELNTILMESTFRIHGPKKDQTDKISFGTSFLMGKPVPSDKAKLYYVLVSAGHVYDEIDGDDAFLLMRKPKADGTYDTPLWKIKLRDNGKNLYVKNPSADVAALYVDMPDDLNVTVVPTALLATDELLKRFEVHPGDELMTLGFPLLVSSPFGYPVLRSGRISSFPIIPTNVVKRIYFNFNVFSGNSGGPVYFVDRHRYYQGQTHLGEVIQFVIGVEIEELRAALFDNQPLGVAGVVPSPFIIETIDSLPATSPYK